MKRIINIKEMCELIGKDRRTLWAYVRDGQFPKPYKQKSITLGWSEEQYEKWLNDLEGGE